MNKKKQSYKQILNGDMRDEFGATKRTIAF